MPKVYCAASDCKWNSVKNQCAAKEIHLADNYVMTVYDGRQHFNKCHGYEMSDEAKRTAKLMKELFFNDRNES